MLFVLGFFILNVCIPPINSYAEPLTSSLAKFGDGAPKEIIKFK